LHETGIHNPGVARSIRAVAQFEVYRSPRKYKKTRKPTRFAGFFVVCQRPEKVIEIQLFDG